ncbi:MAG: flavin prenyltransferase UbiX [Pirellulaceae bacterium]
MLRSPGASGVVYGQRLVRALMELDQHVLLTISESGRQVLKHERRVDVDLTQFQLADLLEGDVPRSGQTDYFYYQDFMTPIASGSHRTRGMVVCPCSGSTLSGIATASSSNLIQRAADVHLKERRQLILVPRETPLSLIQLDNMKRVTEAGAIVLPASPGFYHGAERVEQLVDFVVARILDQLDIEHQLTQRWGD